jgi:intergrase/recombinase
MAQREYSDYQKKVISKYYNHLDVLMLNKLQELVSELYLADSEAKQKRLWERVHKAMLNLQIPQPLIEHIIGRKDVEILARNLQDWLRDGGRKTD